MAFQGNCLLHTVQGRLLLIIGGYIRLGVEGAKSLVAAHLPERGMGTVPVGDSESTHHLVLSFARTLCNKCLSWIA